MSAKNIRLIVHLSISLLIPWNIFAQQAKTRVALENSKVAKFDITGYVDGLKDGEKVYAKLDTGTIMEQYMIADSVYVKNGVFTINGIVENGPRKYRLFFGDRPYKTISLLISTNDHIIIHSKDIDLIPHDILDNYVNVTGSKSNRSYHDFWEMIRLLHQGPARINRYIKIIKDSVGFDPSATGSLMAARDQFNEALYWNYLQDIDSGYHSEAALPYLLSMLGYMGRSSLVPQIYSELSEKNKNSFYGRKLHENARLCIGQPFPMFTLPAPDGKLLSLQEVIPTGKMTLVHFWATNSIERTTYQDELRALYAKYHAKGFNIVGVSSDDSSTEYSYRKMLREHPFPWPNVCDLKGRAGIVETVYHEFGNDRIHNTTNVLIDEKGNIVAWDPVGAELQWYLWRCFEAEKDKHTN